MTDKFSSDEIILPLYSFSYLSTQLWEKPAGQISWFQSFRHLLCPENLTANNGHLARPLQDPRSTRGLKNKEKMTARMTHFLLWDASLTNKNGAINLRGFPDFIYFLFSTSIAFTQKPEHIPLWSLAVAFTGPQHKVCWWRPKRVSLYRRSCLERGIEMGSKDCSVIQGSILQLSNHRVCILWTINYFCWTVPSAGCILQLVEYHRFIIPITDDFYGKPRTKSPENCKSVIELSPLGRHQLIFLCCPVRWPSWISQLPAASPPPRQWDKWQQTASPLLLQKNTCVWSADPPGTVANEGSTTGDMSDKISLPSCHWMTVRI